MQGNLEKNCYQEAARVYGVDKIGCFSPFLCIVFLMHSKTMSIEVHMLSVIYIKI